MTHRSQFFTRFLPAFLTVVLLVGAFAVFWTLKSSKPADAAWYNASWSYRKQITVDHTKVAGGADLSNFPMLISVVDTDLKYTSFGGKVGKTDGTDILITSSDGSTKLSHQIDKYASSTGETVLWVKIPTLSVSTDTVLYIYFGNSGAADQQDVADGSNDVWDTNYKLVWHLGDGTTLAAPDATSNSNTGTVSGATATAGKIGGGGNFSGSAQEITRANTASIGVGAGDSTVSAWIYINAYASAAAVYDKGASGSRDYSFFVTSETSGHIAYGNSGGSSWTGTGFTGGTWHYLTVVQTGGVATVYLDGMQNFTKAVLVQANTAATLSLGGNPSTGGSYWNGKLDEFRVSGATRSVGWIQTEFINQSDPSTFYAYGKLGVQTVSSLPAASSAAGAAWYNASWAYRRQITIDHNKVATSTSFSNFPVVFSSTNADFKHTSFGGKVGKTDGTDILFTSSDGTTKLSHEIEKYSSSTGETVLWVKVPTLSGTTDTVLYVYFGNSGATDQQDTANVWTGQTYRGVYHLANTTDSKNARNLTTDGTQTSSGKIDGGYSFNGTSQEAYGGNYDADNDANLTMSIWVTPLNDWESTEGDSRIFDLISGGDSNGCEISYDSTVDATLEFKCTLPSVGYAGATYTANFPANVPFYIVATFDDTNDLQKLYVNGVNVGTNGTFTQSILYNTGVTMYADIAARITGLDKFSDMIADEARIIGGVLTPGWIQTEYNNQSDPSGFYALGGLQAQTRSTAGVKVGAATSAGAAWYNASWTYRRQITVDHTKVATSSSLSNFPMLFKVTDNELKYTSFGGRVGKTDGTDILFTDSSGTKLNHEIEKYSSSTGETIIWVNVPTLSGATDTTLYIYYGNAGAADQQNATSTWDSFYKAVYHLGNGTTLSLNDSTTNAYNLTNNSTVYPATGQIGGGASATSTAAFATRSAMSALAFNAGDIITLEAWAKRNDGTSYRPIISLVKAGSSSKRNFELDFNGGGVGETVPNSISFHYRESGDSSWAGYFHTTADIDTSAYHHYVFTYTYASSATAKLYVDGVQVGAGWANTGNAAPVTDVDTLVLFNTQNVGSETLNGFGDEVRVSKGAIRGADWVSTEYSNQSSPSTFYSFGSTQTSSKSGAGGTGSAPAVKVRGQVKIR